MTIRQSKMIKQIAYGTYANKLTIDAAKELNQLIFGSLIRRRWVDYNVKGYFFVTVLGKVEHEKVRDWEMYRKNSEGEVAKAVQKIVKTLERKRKKWQPIDVKEQ